MVRSLSCLAVVALMLSVSSPLMAGGPPRLCLPIDGVTTDNVEACVQLVTAGLVERHLEHHQLGIDWYEGQAYLIFAFNAAEMKLSDLDDVLKDSPYSIPRDQLRFFGPVGLVIAIDEDGGDQLISDLSAIDSAAIEATRREGELLLVTAIMPHEFTRSIFVTLNSASKAGDLAAAETLLSYEALSTMAATRGGVLRDVRWRCWGCRMLGCVLASVESAGSK